MRRTTIAILIVLAVGGCIAVLAQTTQPVGHGIARSVEHREGDPTNPAATDLIVTDYDDGLHEERPVAIEPSERLRRLRVLRIKAFRSNPVPIMAPQDMRTWLNDLTDVVLEGG